MFWVDLQPPGQLWSLRTSTMLAVDLLGAVGCGLQGGPSVNWTFFPWCVPWMLGLRLGPGMLEVRSVTLGSCLPVPVCSRLWCTGCWRWPLVPIGMWEPWVCIIVLLVYWCIIGGVNLLAMELTLWLIIVFYLYLPLIKKVYYNKQEI